MNGKQIVLAVLVTALFVLGIVATWVIAQDSVDEYFACVKNSSGAIRMVDPEDTCNSNEHLINWNQAGPAGESWYEAQFISRSNSGYSSPGYGFWTYTCPGGERLISGGFYVDRELQVVDSYPYANNTMYLTVYNPTTSDRPFTVFGLCVQPTTLTESAESGENTLIVTEVTEEEIPVQLPAQ